MAEFILGMNAKIYEGPADTALGSLTEMSNVTDVALNLTAGEADITTRANSGWRGTAPTLREATVEFEMVWKTDDACFQAIRNAYLANTTVALAVLTGDKNTSDSEGPLGNWSITNFSRNEPLEEAVKASVTAKLSTFTQWVEVA